MNNIESFIKLTTENPELPVVPLVDSEVVADDCYEWWKAEFGKSEIEDVYVGKGHVHIKSLDDIEDVISDFYNGNGNIWNLTDEEREKVYADVPWKKSIIVWIQN